MIVIAKKGTMPTGGCLSNTQHEKLVGDRSGGVLLEKLTGSHLVKKFPALCGIQNFITAFTSARHPSLSSAR
jgi:hypothetical protein